MKKGKLSLIKKFSALLLVFLMIFSLTSCKGINIKVDSLAGLEGILPIKRATTTSAVHTTNPITDSDPTTIIDITQDPTYTTQYWNTTTKASTTLATTTTTSTTAKVEEPVEEREIRNVIFLIGDGMGINHLNATKQKLGVKLSMEAMPTRAWAETYSKGFFTKEITDSAAAGTALACGIKTYNGMVGVAMFDPFYLIYKPMNITEVAMTYGMLTGVVSSKSIIDATPAAFSAHTKARSDSSNIAKQQIKSGINLIMGGAATHNHDSNSATPEIPFISESVAKENGYVFVDTAAKLRAVKKGSKIYGQFDATAIADGTKVNDTPTLLELTKKSIEMLENEKGFFLMVEGGHIDNYSHANDLNKMANALVEFDKAVAYALEYAKGRTDTIVIVTADHETGDLKADSNGIYKYNRTGHSNADVPVFVYGSGHSFTEGVTINNIDIPKKIAQYLSLGNFPRNR